MTDNDDFESVFSKQPDGESSSEGEQNQPELENNQPEPENQNPDEKNEGNEEGEGHEGSEDPHKEEIQKTVPIAALHEERDARKALKTEVGELQSQLNEMATVQHQLMQVLQSQTQQKAPNQNEQQFVDPLEDPKAFVDGVENRVQQMIAPVQQNMQGQEILFREQQSLLQAQMVHGPELVQAAVDAVHQAGLTNQLRAYSSDPVGEAVNWFKNQQIVNETGGDLEGFKAQIEEELRAKILAETQQDQGHRQASKSVSKDNIPPSLNKQTGTGKASPSETDGDFFNGIFD